MNGRPLQKSSDSGFTLTEAIVVLLLVSVAMAGFAFFTNPLRSGVKLQAITIEMASVLRYARSEAVADNNEVAFVFDAATRNYFTQPGKTVRSLPAAIGVTVTAARLRGQRENQSEIIFFGDGSSTGGTIEITLGSTSNRIEVGWLTGGVSISELSP